MKLWFARTRVRNQSLTLGKFVISGVFYHENRKRAKNGTKMAKWMFAVEGVRSLHIFVEGVVPVMITFEITLARVS